MTTLSIILLIDMNIKIDYIIPINEKCSKKIMTYHLFKVRKVYNCCKEYTWRVSLFIVPFCFLRRSARSNDTNVIIFVAYMSKCLWKIQTRGEKKKDNLPYKEVVLLHCKSLTCGRTDKKRKLILLLLFHRSFSSPFFFLAFFFLLDVSYFSIYLSFFLSFTLRFYKETNYKKDVIF